MGGIALVAPLVIGVTLAIFASDQSGLVIRAVAFGIIVSELLIQAVLAPLVGYRRRYVLWSLLPLWGWVIAWQFGTRLARLSRTGSPQVRDSSVAAH